MPGPTMWERTKRGSVASLNKIWSGVDKLGVPVNKASNKLGSEAFWPTTLDKESLKAARILRSFTKDGFYEDDDRHDSYSPTHKHKAWKKIPAEVIQNAQGLAIFTTLRTGLWLSGSGGSGVLVARTANGSWSPPSGLMIHTTGVGFLAGVDICDCVLVLNTPEAVQSFSKIRCTLGGELSATAGPVGTGGTVESELHKRQAPIFAYMKSRGFYPGLQIDGTIIIERADENERFYRERLSAADILAGHIAIMPDEGHPLHVLDATLRAAEGLQLESGEERILPTDPTPSDYTVHAGAADSDAPDRSPSHSHRPSVSTIGTDTSDSLFGVPAATDPDPFGVRALEQSGLMIREAGSQRRCSSEQFDFHPSPQSPIYHAFRQSIDARSVSSLNGAVPPGSRRSSWRSSLVNYSGFGRERAGSVPVVATAQSPTTKHHGGSSLRTSMSGSPVQESGPHKPKYVTIDMGTQCDADDLPPAPLTPNRTQTSPPMFPPRLNAVNVIPEIPEEREAWSRTTSGDIVTLNVPITSVMVDTEEQASPPRSPPPDRFNPARLSVSHYHGNDVSPTTMPVEPAEPVSTPLKLDESPTETTDFQAKPDQEEFHVEETKPEVSTDDGQSSHYTSLPSAGTSPAPSIRNEPAVSNSMDGAQDSTHNVDISANPEDASDAEDELDLDDVEPAEIVTVSSIQPTPKAVSAKPVSVSRAKIVNVPKRVAPALPPRNPRRGVDSTPMTPVTPGFSGFGRDTDDSAEEKIEPPVRSPLRGRRNEVPPTPISATADAFEDSVKENQEQKSRDVSRGRRRVINEGVTRLTSEESRSMSPVPGIDSRTRVAV